MPTDPLEDLFDKPRNPRDKVHSIASRIGLAPDLADDFLKVTGGIESGNRHYGRGGKVLRSPAGALGFSQVLPATAKQYNLDPYDEDQNIEAGLRYFSEGGDDPVARRIGYLSGHHSKAVKSYKRTGRIPKGGDRYTGVSFNRYVQASGGQGGQKQKVEADPLADLFDTPEADPLADLVETAPQAPVITQPRGRGAGMARATANPPMRSMRRVPVSPFEGVTGGVTPPATGMGDLRRIDDPEAARIIRNQQQVANEPNRLANTRLLDPKLNDAEEAARRASEEQQAEAEQAKHDEEYQRNKPEIDRLASEYRKAIRSKTAQGITSPLLGVPVGTWSSETLAKGIAPLVEKFAGIGNIAAAGGSPGSQIGVEKLRLHAQALQQAAIEEGASRTEASKFVQDIAGGFIGTAPELAAMSVGVPAPLAFAGGEGLHAYGRGEPVVPALAHGAMTGAAFEIPVAGKGLTRAARRAAATGAATGAVELGTGRTPREAAVTGLTNAAMVGIPAAMKLRGARNAKVENPATKGVGVAEARTPASDRVEPTSTSQVNETPSKGLRDAKVETKPDTSVQGRDTSTSAGTRDLGDQSRLGSVIEGSPVDTPQPAGTSRGQQATPHHSQAQPRRVRNTEHGTKGQFKKGSVESEPEIVRQAREKIAARGNAAQTPLPNQANPRVPAPESSALQRTGLPDLVEAQAMGTSANVSFTKSVGESDLRAMFPEFVGNVVTSDGFQTDQPRLSIQRTRSQIRPDLATYKLIFRNETGQQTKAPSDLHERFGLTKPLTRGAEPSAVPRGGEKDAITSEPVAGVNESDTTSGVNRGGTMVSRKANLESASPLPPPLIRGARPSLKEQTLPSQPARISPEIPAGEGVRQQAPSSPEREIAERAFRHLRDNGLRNMPRDPVFLSLDMGQRRSIGSKEITLTPETRTKQTAFVVFPDSNGQTGWAYSNPRGGNPESARQAGFSDRETPRRAVLQNNGEWLVGEGEFDPSIFDPKVEGVKPEKVAPSKPLISGSRKPDLSPPAVEVKGKRLGKSKPELSSESGKSAEQEVESKQPWEMTRAEYTREVSPPELKAVHRGSRHTEIVRRNEPSDLANAHRAAVEDAIARGEKVSPKVLKDYPWLAADEAIKPYVEGLGKLSDKELKAEEKRVGNELNKWANDTPGLLPDGTVNPVLGGQAGFEISNKFNAIGREIEARKVSPVNRLGDRSDYDRQYPPGSRKRAAYERGAKAVMDRRFKQAAEAAQVKAETPKPILTRARVIHPKSRVPVEKAAPTAQPVDRYTNAVEFLREKGLTPEDARALSLPKQKALSVEFEAQKARRLKGAQPEVVSKAAERKAKRAADKAAGIRYRHSGADPYELIDDLIVEGWNAYSKGKPKFEEWSKQMKDRFGDESEPHLRTVYAQLGGTFQSTTSAKHEESRKDRAEFGLDELPPQATQKDVDLFREAKVAHKADPTEARRIADKVLDEKHALSAKETVQLDVAAQDIKNKHNKVMNEIGETSDPKVIQSKSVDADLLLSELDRLNEATDRSGSEQARAFRARRHIVNQEFDFLSLRNQAKKAKGRDLTPQETERYQGLVKERDQAIKDRDLALEQLHTKRLQQDIDKSARQRRRSETKATLDEEAAMIRSNIVAEFAKMKSQQSSTFSSGGLGNLDPEGVITKQLIKYARNRAKANIGLKAEALIDEVHGFIQDIGVTRRQVAEALSGYGQQALDRRSEATRRLASIRSEIQSVLKAEDVAAGRRSPRQEGPKRDFTRNQIRLEQLRKQEAEWTRRLNENDFEPRAASEPFPYNSEVRKADDRVRLAEAKFKQEMERQRPGHQLRNVSGVIKSWLLSGPGTQAMNITGTGTYQAFREIARLPAAIADVALMKPFTGRRSITGPSPSAMLDSVVQAGTVGGREFREIMKHGATKEQMERHQYQEIDFGVNTGNKVIDKGVKVIELAHNAIFRMMSASDRVFYQGAYKRNLIDRARVQALNEKAPNVRERTKELTDNPPEQLEADARHDALVSTFNNNNWLSTKIKRARSAVINKESLMSRKSAETLNAAENLALDFVLPFDRTPTNVVSRIVEASPLGYGKNAGQLIAAAMRRSMPVEHQRQFSQTFGNATAGSALMALGWYLNNESGLISVEEYDVYLKIPGLPRINLRTASPAGNILAAGARLREVHKNEKSETLDYAKPILREPLNIPILRAASPITETMRDPKRAGPKTAARFASMAVPFGGAVRFAANTKDPVKRKARGFVENIQKGIPVWRESLPEDAPKPYIPPSVNTINRRRTYR